jgi:hypothetical protein
MILIDFDAFIIYYNITSLKEDYTDFFVSKFKALYKNLQELGFNNLNDCEISSIINEFIFCFFVLYDLNEENKIKIKNIFQNNILIYIFVYAFSEKKDNSFEEFLENEENKEFIQKILKYFNSKYKIFCLLCDEKEENMELNNENDLKKKSKNIQELIGQSTNVILKNQIFEIPTFNIIKLPENFIDFSSNNMQINCIYCKTKIINYFICLICGSKICNQKKCIVDKKEKGKKEYSLIAHSKKCGGGNVFFISGKTSEIIYLHKRCFFFSGIHVYLNSFGEYFSESNLNSNYKLNQFELDKSIKLFIDLTYRKKGYKIIYQ